MSKTLKVWMNGSLVPWEQAQVPLLSHGFSRGSAIFEVFGILPLPGGPAAFRMDLHLRRLLASAEALGMELAQTAEQIGQAVAKVVQANGMQRGLIKLFAYYGDETLADLVLDSNLDLAIFTFPDHSGASWAAPKPIAVCFTKWKKIDSTTVPATAKACANYLNGMLARKDAMNRGYDLGLLLDGEGFVAEGSMESVFMVKDGVLITPPLGKILHSITRKTILETATAACIPVSETPIRPEELVAADEIFTCNSLIKVLPVRRIEERDLDPTPGPVTARLSLLISDICAGRGSRFLNWLQPLG